MGMGALVACTSLDVLGVRTGPGDAGEPMRDLPNPLQERQQVPVSQVNAKVNDAFLQLFFGDPETEAVFRDQGDGTGYIEDVFHSDVRTDSMGYGLLVTVQLDQRQVFDKLWSWTREHMRVETGPAAGLLGWQCDLATQTCATVAATDASSIIATSLLIAEQRWGARGAHDYGQEGRRLLETMTSIEERNGGVVDGVVDCFDVDASLPRRGSTSPAQRTPVDYLMPAFYELWSRRDPERADLWRRMAIRARSLLERVSHPVTGLLPEVVGYDGTPVNGQDDYRFTTSRTLLNLALDHIWYGPHAWVVEQNERRLDFFLGEGLDRYVSEYTSAGDPLVSYNTPAHRALVAVAAGTSPRAEYDVFLQALLDEPVPTGELRYYDGMLYLLSLLLLSGQLAPG